MLQAAWAAESDGGDLESALDGLRLRRREETCIAACLDHSGLVPFESISTFLSILAESIARRALGLARRAASAGSTPLGFAVIGMGKIAGRLADRTFLTADNPKHEDPDAILDEIEAGLRPTGGGWERIVDRAEAIGRAVERAKPGDVILVAGKGHERYQIVGDAFVPYSDRDVLEELGFVPNP